MIMPHATLPAYGGRTAKSMRLMFSGDNGRLQRNERADAFFDSLRKVYLSELRLQVAEFVDYLRSYYTPVDSAIIQAWRDRLIVSIRPYYIEMVKDGFALAGMELGLGKAAPSSGFRAKDDSTFTIINTLPDPLDFLTAADFTAIDAWVATTALAQSKTTAKRLTSIFLKASQYYDKETGRGMTPDAIAKEILTAGLAQTKPRAVMLARTGSIWAYNEGAQKQYQAAGVAVVEWMTVKDDLTCPFCRAMNGIQVPTMAPFVEQGQEFAILDDDGKRKVLSKSMPYEIQHPPLHPHCRCALIPVIDV